MVDYPNFKKPSVYGTEIDLVAALHATDPSIGVNVCDETKTTHEQIKELFERIETLEAQVKKLSGLI